MLEDEWIGKSFGGGSGQGRVLEEEVDREEFWRRKWTGKSFGGREEV